MRNLVPVIVILFLINFSDLQSAEQRGIWVVRQAFSSQGDLDRFFQTISELKITDIYFQVRALGETFYSSAPHPVNHSIKGRQDWLKLLITGAHERKIRVHAWLNALYVWSGANPPADPGHIFYQSQKDILRSPGDRTIPDYTELRDKGIEGFFVDPQDEHNFYSLKDIMDDLMKRYELDGFHLDYFRYPSFEYSFSPTNRSDFILEHYIDPAEVFKNPAQFENMRGLQAFSYVDEAFREFLGNRLTILLHNLRQHLTTVNGNLHLSIAVKPSVKKARQEYLQCWDEWLAGHLCDGVLLMNYIPDPEEFRKNIQEAALLPEKSRIIIGIGLYNIPEEEIKRRIKEAGQAGFGGIALFSYNYLSQHPRLAGRIKSVGELSY